MDKEKIRAIIWYTAVILDAIEIIWGAVTGAPISVVLTPLIMVLAVKVVFYSNLAKKDKK